MVLALLTKEDIYGYQITKDIQEHFAVSESTLYPVLRRLQKNGSLTTYDRPYQGRNRRYYRITVSGRALLDQYRKDWLTYKQQRRRSAICCCALRLWTAVIPNCWRTRYGIS